MIIRTIMYKSSISFIIIAAFILDCILGDPQNPYHPMRIIGNGIYAGVNIRKKSQNRTPTSDFVYGLILSVVIIGLAYTLTWIIRHFSYRINTIFGYIVESILCYFLIAPKALKDESMKVYHSIIAGDIENARLYLSYIVGRDTMNLEMPELVKGAVETVAENLSDGVIAPLLFILVGGAPLGMAYKAVNTLDSMIGYRNEQYEYLGKFAARLDDVVNFIPARLSAMFMILGSLIIGADYKNAIAVYKRDRLNHKSPNSAQTEAVCAGALGLCLGGDNYYKGELVHKPTIGDNINEPLPEHIPASNRLMYAATISAVAIIAIGNILFMALRI